VVFHTCLYYTLFTLTSFYYFFYFDTPAPIIW
jgi:hypothetical protein